MAATSEGAFLAPLTSGNESQVPPATSPETGRPETLEEKLKRLEDSLKAFPIRPDNAESEFQRLVELRRSEILAKGGSREEADAVQLQVRMSVDQQRIEYEAIESEIADVKRAIVVKIAESAKLQEMLRQKEAQDPHAFLPTYYLLIGVGAVFLTHLMGRRS